jgi:hypothetical protein
VYIYFSSHFFHIPSLACLLCKATIGRVECGLSLQFFCSYLIDIFCRYLIGVTIRGRLYCESASLRVASLRVASLRVASLRVASCESASCESASCESASLRWGFIASKTLT